MARIAPSAERLHRPLSRPHSRPNSRRNVELSSAERSRRAAVFHPKNGFGFAHGSTRLSASAHRRLDLLLTQRALRPGAVITLTIGTSGSGSLAANQRVAASRARVAVAALRQRGFTGEIKVLTKMAPPDGNDDPAARTATFRVGAGADRFDGRRALGELVQARGERVAQRGVMIATPE